MVWLEKKIKTTKTDKTDKTDNKMTKQVRINREKKVSAKDKNEPPQIIDQYIASAKTKTMYRNAGLASLISVHRDFT